MMISGLVWSLSLVGAETCLSCHEARDGGLVAQWQKSGHATLEGGCTLCHGTEHQGNMARRARLVAACTDCHTRQLSSYTLSKHGVIVTLEGDRLDFSQPLQEGNQRAPTCAYCHLHRGHHDTGRGIFPLSPMGRMVASEDLARSEARETPCLDCHSPRLVTTWFASGDRMVDIGRMKVREASQVAANLPPDQAVKAQPLLHQMTDSHLRHVFLGVGHQSPDDQWWHGHPALDGDLLRIKSLATP